MALLKAAEVRAMRPEDRQKRLYELRTDLVHERGVAAMGGSPPSPGKIRQIRTAIARLLTIQNQERAGTIQFTKKELAKAPPAAPKAEAKPAPRPKAKTAPAKPQAKKPAAAKAAPASKPKRKEV